MSVPLTPQRARAYELLADGEWHEREAIIRKIFPVIQPGAATREAEAQRRGYTQAPEERKTPRSQEFLILSGKRALARDALRTPRIEHKQEGEQFYVRLRPMVTMTREERAKRGLAVRPERPRKPVTTERGRQLISTENSRSTGVLPWTAEAMTILGDGEWHDREKVVEAMMAKVPRADALEHQEWKRQWPYKRRGQEPPPRSRSANEDALARSGARSMCLMSLNNNKRVVRQDVDGRAQIRLRPPLIAA